MSLMEHVKANDKGDHSSLIRTPRVGCAKAQAHDKLSNTAKSKCLQNKNIELSSIWPLKVMPPSIMTKMDSSEKLFDVSR